jgi:hypothetical protein
MQGNMLLGKMMPKIRSLRRKSAISKDVTYSFTDAMMPYGNMQPRLHKQIHSLAAGDDDLNLVGGAFLSLWREGQIGSAHGLPALSTQPITWITLNFLIASS